MTLSRMEPARSSTGPWAMSPPVLPARTTPSHIDLTQDRPDEPDDVAQALLDAQRLIEHALGDHHSRSQAVSEVAADDSGLVAVARQLVGSARFGLLCVLPADSRDQVLVHEHLRTLDVASRAGLRVRLLLTHAVLASAATWQVVDGLTAQIDLRVTAHQVQPMLIVDEAAALVWWRHAPDRQALLVRTPPVLRALALLFLGTAEPAPALSDFRRTSHRRTCAHTQQILGFLGRGVKDEVACRELGISVRTYRRHVSDLMRELEVTSRFQAGARAAQLRLVASPSSAPVPPAGRTLPPLVHAN